MHHRGAYGPRRPRRRARARVREVRALHGALAARRPPARSLLLPAHRRGARRHARARRQQRTVALRVHVPPAGMRLRTLIAGLCVLLVGPILLLRTFLVDRMLRQAGERDRAQVAAFERLSGAIEHVDDLVQAADGAVRRAAAGGDDGWRPALDEVVHDEPARLAALDAA